MLEVSVFAEHSPTPPWTGHVGTMVGETFKQPPLCTRRKAAAEKHPWLQRTAEMTVL